MGRFAMDFDNSGCSSSRMFHVEHQKEIEIKNSGAEKKEWQQSEANKIEKEKICKYYNLEYSLL